MQVLKCSCYTDIEFKEIILVENQTLMFNALSILLHFYIQLKILYTMLLYITVCMYQCMTPVQMLVIYIDKAILHVDVNSNVGMFSRFHSS